MIVVVVDVFVDDVVEVVVDSVFDVVGAGDVVDVVVGEVPARSLFT